jgi:hypothetical protein
MKTNILKSLTVAVGLIVMSGCGGSEENSVLAYRQIERLARPGINEALILSSAKHAAFNSIAPSLDLSSDAAVASVRADAVAVLGAIKAYGDANVATSAATVNNTAGGFLPDVMRINTANSFSPTSVSSSATNTFPGAYASDFAGTAPSTPDVDRADPLRLTGGRMITDDVIDVTYTYLIAGLAAQIVDGVSYCGQNTTAQGHHALTGWADQAFPCTTTRQAASFPFLAAPN